MVCDVYLNKVVFFFLNQIIVPSSPSSPPCMRRPVVRPFQQAARSSPIAAKLSPGNERLEHCGMDMGHEEGLQMASALKHLPQTLSRKKGKK